MGHSLFGLDDSISIVNAIHQCVFHDEPTLDSSTDACGASCSSSSCNEENDVSGCKNRRSSKNILHTRSSRVLNALRCLKMLLKGPIVPAACFYLVFSKFFPSILDLYRGGDAHLDHGTVVLTKELLLQIAHLTICKNSVMLKKFSKEVDSRLSYVSLSRRYSATLEKILLFCMTCLEEQSESFFHERTLKVPTGMVLMLYAHL